MSKKRPDAGAEGVASDLLKIRSVCRFRTALRVERSPADGLYANDCTFNSNSIAQSRFEIVNPAA